MQQKDIQVVGEAADGRQVLNRVQVLQPHILLLDLQTPRMNGLEVLPRRRGKSPRTKIPIRADYFAATRRGQVKFALTRYS